MKTYNKKTEDYIQEILKECNGANSKLDKLETIRKQLLLPLCGHRTTIQESFEYAKMLSDSAGKEGMTVLTAVGVVINSIRYEMEQAMEADSTFPQPNNYERDDDKTSE
mgnify:CR=1 FL=1